MNEGTFSQPYSWDKIRSLRNHFNLAHSITLLHFYTPWKRQKTRRFLNFSGGYSNGRFTWNGLINILKYSKNNKYSYVMRCAIWFHLRNLKNMKTPMEEWYIYQFSSKRSWCSANNDVNCSLPLLSYGCQEFSLRYSEYCVFHYSIL